jgi:hypothetical protein
MKIPASPSEIARVEAEAGALALRRVRDREARGLPVTAGVVALISRDEARRAARGFAAMNREVP